MRPWLLSVPLLLAAIAALLVAASDARAGAIIDNGVVQIGVNDEAELIVGGGPPSSATGITSVGLRYLPTAAESTADGCTCEGWGISYTDSATATATSGFADTIYFPPATGLTTLSFASTASTAVSRVQMGNLTIQHDYHPAGATPFLYEVTVELTNLGGTRVDDITYRRAMDWDIEPTPFSEMVTIDATAPLAPQLVYSSDDGFSSPDPLVPAGGPLVAGALGPPAPGAAFFDLGPSDHGAVFDFDFGSLGPGSSTRFTIYYGAAGNETDALGALAAVGAEVWSLGQPSTPYGASLGDPNTFIFAFGNLSIRLLPPVPDFTWEFTTTAPLNYTLDPVQFTDLTVLPTNPAPDPVRDPLVVTYAWTLGDTDVANVQNPMHPYDDDGIYTVCLTVTVRLPRYSLSSSGMVCHDVPVNNRPPEARFTPLAPLPSAVRFLDRSGDDDGVVAAWSWDFGDGSVVTTQSPGLHAYGAAGTYLVCLTVTDDDGAQHTTCFPVHVDLPPGVPDADDDGVQDEADNCPESANRLQEDADHDGVGDACEGPAPAPSATGATVRALGARPGDRDGDGVADAADVCPSVADRSQADADRDGQGDACDADADGDGIAESGLGLHDNCPLVPNTTQGDRDGDGVGDACDATPGLAVASSGAAARATPGRSASALGDAANGARSPSRWAPWAWAGAGVLGALLVLAGAHVALRRSPARKG